jgi:hypothetical protein
MRRTLLFLLPFLAMLCSASPAAAQTRLFIPCPSGVPCSTEVYAHIDRVSADRLPWVASVIAPSGVCFAALSDSGDSTVRISVIAPNGTVYREGPIGQPVYTVVAFRTPVNGWYTVQLDSFPPGREQIATLKLSMLEYAAGCHDTPPR